MKKYVLIFVVLFGIITFSDILNFVPYDYDIFIRFRNSAGWYKELKNVPFAKFVLNDEGLSFESYFLGYLEDIDYKHGTDKNIFLSALASDVLFLAKGIEISVENLISFDANYYIEILKTLSKDSALIFETNNSDYVIKYFSNLIGYGMKKEGDIYILGDSIFSKSIDDYLVLAGSKNALEYMINVYNSPNLQFKSNSKEYFKDFDSGSKYWITGFSKGNAIQLNFPIESTDEGLETEYVKIFGYVEDSVLKISIIQKTNKEEPKVTFTEDLMEEIPVLGNYFAGISIGDSLNVMRVLEQWTVTLDSTSLEKLYDLTSSILKNATSTFYIVGDIDESPNLSVAFLFKLSDGLQDIERTIKKYSGRYDDTEDQWIIDITDEYKVYFYEFEQFFVVSNIDKETYSKKAKIQRLTDLAAYNYLDRERNYNIKIFLDLGDFIQKFLGINISSKLIFWEEKDGHFIKYYLDIM
ncbi:hypothetical protein [Thermosipho atlanticus]|uniref:DUF3352 domain-containing protein n=1 Tax=Thermosipho atlanticus DSM 15807 TaxID=1123380 RepID=A0A1M5TK22_9BACT|nr:hypothetical protein [Thermosipho atlanticus]SHH50693.1 hypothetical protein SAMN02745199_1340 [Thermosipho atlanticus DSM 15807]